MTSLFIGGCADGQWLAHSNDANHWQVVEPSPLPAPSVYDNKLTFDKMFASIHHTYRRERLGAPGKTWTIFVIDSMSMTEAMDRLLDNYRP